MISDRARTGLKVTRCESLARFGSLSCRSRGLGVGEVADDVGG